MLIKEMDGIEEGESWDSEIVAANVDPGNEHADGRATTTTDWHTSFPNGIRSIPRARHASPSIHNTIKTNHTTEAKLTSPPLHCMPTTMSTRKSLSRKSRVSRAADDASPLAAVTTEAPPLHEQEQPVASSSKVKLDMPPLDVPESITWDYEPQPREPQALTKDQKEEFIQEVGCPFPDASAVCVV